MKSLYVVCEGESEQGFCSAVLFPHFWQCGVYECHAPRIGGARRHGDVAKGGIVNYEHVRNAMRNWLKTRPHDAELVITTMFDLFRLPPNFPGKEDHACPRNDYRKRVEYIERRFHVEWGDNPRLIPYIQLHEFETLLFADLAKLATVFENCDPAIVALTEQAAKFAEIEQINEGDETAPSKRIIKLIPAYNGRKSTAGPQIAAAIGLPKLRESCPHFDDWLKRLESRL